MNVSLIQDSSAAETKMRCRIQEGYPPRFFRDAPESAAW
jgi:hypothetical protein